MLTEREEEIGEIENGEPELANCISELFLGAAAMDVDLRQFGPMPTATGATTTTVAVEPVNDTDDREMNNRKSQQHSSADEGDSYDDDEAPPFAKKSKSEKMDM